MSVDHFKSQKEKYLNGHTLVFSKGGDNDYDGAPGVSYFDLVKDLNKTKTYTLTRRFKPLEKEKKHLICAAWLPVEYDKAMEIDLGDRAYNGVEYFFTAELTGCRLEIGCDAQPKVVHIHASLGGCPNRSLAEMSAKAIAEYDTRLDAVANERFGQQPHRKYSKRSGYPTPGAKVTVVGYRKETMWVFFAQERVLDKQTNEPTRMVRRISTTDTGRGEPCELR